jgi:hypothetical protein
MGSPSHLSATEMALKRLERLNDWNVRNDIRLKAGASIRDHKFREG